MQKQERIIKKFYIALQADYNSIWMGIGHEQKLYAQTSISKLHACQKFMPTLLDLLQSHNLTFADCTFITVNRGPAPFTTLRIVITTANALNFAKKIPLVGVDALQVFAQNYQHIPYAVIILNAFAQDLYFAYYDKDKTLHTGCQNNRTFLHNLATQWPSEKITFIGNGALLYQDALHEFFGKRAVLPEQQQEYVTLEQIAHAGVQQWEHDQKGVDTLLPLYLKIQNYVPST